MSDPTDETDEGVGYHTTPRGYGYQPKFEPAPGAYTDVVPPAPQADPMSLWQMGALARPDLYNDQGQPEAWRQQAGVNVGWPTPPPPPRPLDPRQIGSLANPYAPDLDPLLSNIVGGTLGDPANLAMMIPNPAGTPAKVALTAAQIYGGLTGEAEAGKAKGIKTLWSNLVRDEPLDAVTALTKPTRQALEKVIKPSDLQGSQLMPLMGDRTWANQMLAGIGDTGFANPVPLQGGHGYMEAMAPHGAAWASEPGRTTALLKRAQLAGDDPVHGVYFAMGPTAGDFSHHVSGALAGMLPEAKLGQEAVDSFDQVMRQGDFADFGPVPNFPGLKSQDLPQWLLDTAGANRTKFVQAMDTSTMRGAGAPDVAAARWAVTDPRLRDADTGAAGLSIARLTGSRAAGDVPAHLTYGAPLGGTYAGGLGQSVPFETMFPDIARETRLARPDTAGMSPAQLANVYRYTVERGNKRVNALQSANQSWVDSVSKYLEDVKQGRMGDLARQD